LKNTKLETFRAERGITQISFIQQERSLLFENKETQKAIALLVEQVLKIDKNAKAPEASSASLLAFGA
jgi:hypothetical protein